MELLRPEDRERLLNLRNSSSLPSTKTTTPGSHDSLRSSGSSAVGGAASSGLQQEALAAWRGVQTSSQTFKPFENNPSKQARYELYLNRLKQGDKGMKLCLTFPIMHCRSRYVCPQSPLQLRVLPTCFFTSKLDTCLQHIKTR